METVKSKIAYYIKPGTQGRWAKDSIENFLA